MIPNRIAKAMLLATSLVQLSMANPVVQAGWMERMEEQVLTQGSQLPTYPVGAADATWDGQGFYPKPVEGFQPNLYVGPKPGGDQRSVWYQLAAQDQPFLGRCRCVYARYGSFKNGSVSVENFCTSDDAKGGSRTTSIRGYADPVEGKVYGSGSFQVKFPVSRIDFKGPNYVVDRVYYGKPSSSDKRRHPRRRDEPYSTVLVGSQNFTGWFLLSRTRQVSTEVVYSYLREVADAGYNLEVPYSITNQTGCAPV